MTPKEAERQLLLSCESTRTLYLFMLLVAEALRNEALSRIEAARSKFNPTAEELNPNMKFVHNGIPPLLAEDPDFQKITAKRKLSWEQYDVLLRHLYDSIRSKEYFQAYMNSGENSLAEDAALWVKIFEEEFVDSEELSDILEDLDIWWNDDLAYALTWCCKTVTELGKGRRWALPELFLSDINGSPDSDEVFVRSIVRKGVSLFEKYYESVAALTPKWDKSRICATDLSLIVAGLAEHDSNPIIPAKVTINEYVEISKFYSTSESRSFVNGLLDKLINKQ